MDIPAPGKRINGLACDVMWEDKKDEMVTLVNDLFSQAGDSWKSYFLLFDA